MWSAKAIEKPYFAQILIRSIGYLHPVNNVNSVSHIRQRLGKRSGIGRDTGTSLQAKVEAVDSDAQSIVVKQEYATLFKSGLANAHNVTVFQDFDKTVTSAESMCRN